MAQLWRLVAGIAQPFVKEKELLVIFALQYTLPRGFRPYLIQTVGPTPLLAIIPAVRYMQRTYSTPIDFQTLPQAYDR